eukprot:m.70241 g.70241  ORF g.70241 m.70241 type:complete len:599 (+) comp14288_c0_seq24:350-2146(+)
MRGTGRAVVAATAGHVLFLLVLLLVGVQESMQARKIVGPVARVNCSCVYSTGIPQNVERARDVALQDQLSVAHDITLPAFRGDLFMPLNFSWATGRVINEALTCFYVSPKFAEWITHDNVFPTSCFAENLCFSYNRSRGHWNVTYPSDNLTDIHVAVRNVWDTLKIMRVDLDPRSAETQSIAAEEEKEEEEEATQLTAERTEEQQLRPQTAFQPLRLVLMRFHAGNIYHDIHDTWRVAFQVAAMAGLYDWDNFKLRTEHVTFNVLICDIKRPPRCEREAFFLPMISDFPINYRPENTFCMDRGFIGLPEIEPDDQWNFGFPPFEARYNPWTMLFARESVRRAITMRESSQYAAVSEALAQNARRASPQHRNQKPPTVSDDEWQLWLIEQQASLLASIERRVYWPLTEHVNGTFVTFVVRNESRRCRNYDSLVARFADTFGKRGYPFELVDFNNMTVPEQILVASRSTVMISPHGAGMTNALWMQPGAVLLELSGRQVPDLFFKNLAVNSKLVYFKYVARKTTDPREGMHMTQRRNNDFAIRVEEVMPLVTMALFASDREFGVPPAATRFRITRREVIAAGYDNLRLRNSKHLKDLPVD